MARLTQDALKSRLRYEPDTGDFFWHKAPRGKPLTHLRAGTKSKSGYIRIRVGGSPIGAHRLAWLYTYGKMPTKEIDHINGNTIDNRICNLREAAHHENARNSRPSTENTSGHKGISWSRAEKKWTAVITVLRKTVFLGRFAEIERAIAARNAAEEKYHGDFAYTRRNIRAMFNGGNDEH